MALLEGFLPIEIKEADNIEVNFNQIEQEIEIKLTKNGETINTKVIKLTNSKLKKFWTGVLEGPSIDIDANYQGIEQNDFYYNIDTNELNIVTQVNEENFIVIKVNHRYIKETTPPASYVESDFKYEEGDIWVNSLTKQVWMLVSIDENEEYAWTTIGLPEHIDYDTLEDKPKINGITIEGTKTAADYHLATKTEVNSKQEKLIAGNNITIDANNRIDAEIPSSGINYNDIQNKPQINGVVVNGSKTLNDFNIQSKLTAGNNIAINNGTISATGIPSQLTEGKYIKIDDNNRINVTIPTANGMWKEIYSQATTGAVQYVTIPLEEEYDNYIITFNNPLKKSGGTPADSIKNASSSGWFSIVLQDSNASKVTDFTSLQTWSTMDALCEIRKITNNAYLAKGIAKLNYGSPESVSHEHVDLSNNTPTSIKVGIEYGGLSSNKMIESGITIKVYAMDNDDVEPFPYEIGNGLQVESDTLKFQNGTQKTYITTESDFGDNQVQRTANKTNFPNVQVGDLLVYNPIDPDADDARRLYVADKIGDVGVRWRSLNNYTYLASKPKINGVTIDGDQAASNYGLVDEAYVDNRASNVNFTSNLANYLGSQCSNNSSFVSAMTNMNSNFMTNVKNNLSSDSGFLQGLQGNFYSKNEINKKIKYELLNSVTLDNNSSCVPLLPSSAENQYDDLLLITDATATSATNEKVFNIDMQIDNQSFSTSFDDLTKKCYFNFDRQTDTVWKMEKQRNSSGSPETTTTFFIEPNSMADNNDKIQSFNLRTNSPSSQSFAAGSKFKLYGKKKF